MPANSSSLPNAYAGPRLVPSPRETSAPVKEIDYRPEPGIQSSGLAEGCLTAIDFEVAAALSLYSGRHTEWKSDVYLLRTLERIAEHMKALKAIQAIINQPGADNRVA